MKHLEKIARIRFAGRIREKYFLHLVGVSPILSACFKQILAILAASGSH